MEKWLIVEQSGGSPNQGGVSRVVVKLPEVDRYDFEKIKFNNFKKRVDLRLRMACEG
jgi:hypothetical protein